MTPLDLGLWDAEGCAGNVFAMVLRLLALMRRVCTPRHFLSLFLTRISLYLLNPPF